MSLHLMNMRSLDHLGELSVHIGAGQFHSAETHSII